MGKKGGKSSGYVSKGSVKTISRWAKNAARADHRANPSLDSIKQSVRMKRDCRDSDLRKKYAQEESVMRQASELFSRYGKVATWAACVQAVRTDFVSQFHQKYGAKQARKLNA